MKSKAAGLVVAGTHSGCGKTTVACGLMAAFRNRGLEVQPFKVGPDYLDPGYHALAAGRPCTNLDYWLMPAAAVRASYGERAAQADVCVVEGMMGLYDGLGIQGTSLSTAEMASSLGLPVLLVVDAGAMAESAAAVVHGFATFGAKVAGVVFNRVAGPRHFELLKRALGQSPARDVKAVGWLAGDADIEVPERHLGLVSADPRRGGELLPKLMWHIEKTFDLDAVLEIARQAKVAPARPTKSRAGKTRARIAVARDPAFHFYYEDNLAALRRAGAEIVPFSPMTDSELPPDATGLYLGGGFPEAHAAKLEENRPMRHSVRAAVERGMPTYAECGGLMYLATNLVGTGVRAWEMVGIIPGEIRMQHGLRNFGYVTAATERPSFLVKRGEELRGHEFHYSSWSAEGGDASVYRVRRPGRDDSRLEGFARGSLHASYVHLHFSSAPSLPERFVAAAATAAQGGRRGKTPVP